MTLLVAGGQRVGAGKTTFSTGLTVHTDGVGFKPRAGDAYVVNGTVDVPDAARERLPLADATVIESVEGLNAVIEKRHLAALDALERTIERTKRAVVESYADIARPIRSLNPDAVAVVDPGRARIYDGSRYAKGCSVASGGTTQMEGRLEKRVIPVDGILDRFVSYPYRLRTISGLRGVRAL